MKIATTKGGKNDDETQITIAQEIKEPIDLFYFFSFLFLVFLFRYCLINIIIFF